MLFLFTLLSAFAAHATEECPNLSGHYRDRGPFLYEIRQTGCSELRWETRDAPNSPNPPSEPGTDTFVIDCRKKGDFVRQESLCWNGPVLEQRAYGRNYTGRYVPISVRRLSITETGALADRFFLTDDTGEEKLFQDALYERVSP